MAKLAKKAVKKKAAPAPKALSAVDIEKELSLAHKAVSRAGAALSIMLAVRRLSVKRIEEAALEMVAATNQIQQLLGKIK